MSETSIGDYALLSDRQTAALVSRDGSVDWLCCPRFDTPSIFGALLDPQAGHWSIRPVRPYTATRQYVEPTMVLETRFETPTGVLVVTDALGLGPIHDPHRIGAGAPRLLIRSLRCERGSVEVDVSFCARPEYGLVVPLLSAVDGGLLVRGGTELLALATPVEVAVERDVVTASWTLRAEEQMAFALHRSSITAERLPRIWTQQEIATCLTATIDAWTAWSDIHQNYQGPWRDLVHHSGRVLQALSYQPTGAIVAAATTSLPEEVGGERNWDYRYSWVRDASFTMEALWVAACPDEALSSSSSSWLLPRPTTRQTPCRSCTALAANVI